MSKAIYKYPLRLSGNENIIFPKGAEILTVQVQNDDVCIWALVDPNEKDFEKRFFEVFGTGHPIYYDMGVSRNYISTVQLKAGELVLHVFEYTGV